MATAKKKKLSGKAEKFCREYMKDFNGTQAAIRAGYSKKTAQAISSENLLKPLISARIAELSAEILDAPLEELKLKIRRELEGIGFARLPDLLNEDFSLNPEKIAEYGAAIKEIETVTVGSEKKGFATITKLKLHDKNPALEKLAKYVGLIDDSMKNIFNLIDLNKLSDAQLDRIDAGENPFTVLFGSYAGNTEQK